MTFCSAFSVKKFSNYLLVQRKELRMSNEEAKMLIRDLDSLLKLNRQKSEFENDKAQRTYGAHVMEGGQVKRLEPDVRGPSPFQAFAVSQAAHQQEVDLNFSQTREVKMRSQGQPRR